MKNNSSYKALLCASALSVLAACGSGGDSSSDAPDSIKSEPTKNIGTFIDSPVINIGYRTETLEGITNELGEYEYLTDETVTFFIGDLDLPTVNAKDVLTPLDLSKTNTVNDSKVVNITRLLQTLDQDGDPSNGLTITDTAKSTAYTAVEIDFTLSEIDFQNLSEVDTLIRDSGLNNPVTELVKTTDAISHFQKELNNAQIESDLQVFTSELLDGKTFFSIYIENGNTCSTEQNYTLSTISQTVWLYNSDGSWSANCPEDFGELVDTPYVIDNEGKMTFDGWWFVLSSVTDEQYTITDPDGTFSAYFSKNKVNNILSANQ